MPLIIWNASLETGVEKIDNQHMKLVEMINELDEFMKAEKSKEILEKIIDELIEYTRVHFATEEMYMVRFQFLGYSKHKNEHDNFTEKVKQFQISYQKNEVELSSQILDFLKDWLVGHIQGSDRAYIETFKENGL